jgi:hypothetical protein
VTARERLGPDLVHIVSARRLDLHDLAGAFDRLGAADALAAAMDPEHGGSPC